jgi:hypothetical protein
MDPFVDPMLPMHEYFIRVNIKQTVIKRIKELLVKHVLPQPEDDLQSYPFATLQTMLDDLRFVDRNTTPYFVQQLFIRYAEEN